jgi:hypothetical protein
MDEKYLQGKEDLTTPLKEIISDVWYQWMNEERTEIEIFVADESGKEFSIAQIDVSDSPIDVRFANDNGEEEQGTNKIYDLALEVAHDLGYYLEGEANDLQSKSNEKSAYSEKLSEMSFEELLKETKSSALDDVDQMSETLSEEMLRTDDIDDTHPQGYLDAVEYLESEYQKRLNHEDEEFNGMTVNDALDEIESWDFLDAFGDDAERLSDAVKRVMRFFGRI